METKKYPGSVDAGSSPDNNGTSIHDLTAPEALQRIRAILFGEESQKNDARFQQIAQLIDKRLGDLKSDMDSRLADVATSIGEAQARNAERISEEAKQRSEILNRLEHLIADVDARTSSRIDAAETRVNEVAEISRRDLAETRDHMTAGVSYQIEQLKGFVDDAVAGLAHGKADKQALADWFEQLSSRLRD
ncbi:MAG: hypothetical protein HKN43_12695 [Rhodothermales bacterium]|nr:hypothetical protein [Rhodothermales bacterium]